MENSVADISTVAASVSNVAPVVVPTQSPKYAILMETDGELSESWMYFIKHDGNEEALKSLKETIDGIDWSVDDHNTFDVELDHLVSQSTAKDMVKIDLNFSSKHRKFDGVMQKIDFGFKVRDRNSKKMDRVCKLLEGGRIGKFVTEEDEEDADFTSCSESDGDNSDSGSGSESGSSSSSPSPSPKKKKKVEKPLPKVVQDVPRIAKIKQRHRK